MGQRAIAGLRQLWLNCCSGRHDDESLVIGIATSQRRNTATPQHHNISRPRPATTLQFSHLSALFALSFLTSRSLLQVKAHALLRAGVFCSQCRQRIEESRAPRFNSSDMCFESFKELVALCPLCLEKSSCIKMLM